MYKDFDSWNGQKKKINSGGIKKLHHERQIWWCSLGVNIGDEQDGAGKEYQRPVLILKGLGPATCWIVPLTTSRNLHPFRIPVGLIDGKEASAVLSQSRVIDVRRLVDKITMLDKEIFSCIRKAIKDML